LNYPHDLSILQFYTKFTLPACSLQQIFFLLFQNFT
jgi:hypothetical protein